jgi:hypothetical protein
VELQQHIDEFTAAGIRVFAVSYDTVEELAAFSAAYGITYPLLSDRGSAVIRRYRILNTTLAEDHQNFGIPFPGAYVLDPDGRVVEKSFFQQYQVRPAAQSVLRDAFGIDFEVRDNPRAEAETMGVRVHATIGASALAFMRRVPLIVRLDLDDGLHLYGEPIPDGYIPTTVSIVAPEGIEVGPVASPPTRPFQMEGLPDEFHVFEGRTEFTADVWATVREGGPFTFDLTVRYQACDDRQCFLPQEHTLSIEVPLEPLAKAAPVE